MNPTALLLVDESPAVIMSLKRALASESCRVVSARSAAAAFTILAREQIAGVVCGRQLSDMGGTAFLTQVGERHAEVARVLLVGAADFEAIVLAVNCGAVGKLVTVPWRDSHLREIVRQALGTQADCVNGCRIVDQLSTAIWNLAAGNTGAAARRPRRARSATQPAQPTGTAPRRISGPR